MSLSFWINLSSCFGALLFACFEHAETWAEYTSSAGKARRLNLVKVWLLWIIPAAALVATIISAGESVSSDGQIDGLSRSWISASNQMHSATQELAIVKLKADAIELNARDREITSQQHSNLVQCLSSSIKGPIIVAYESLGSGSEEARKYHAQIATVMTGAGFWGSVSNKINRVFLDEPGILLLVKDISRIPPHAYSIQSCFLSNGIGPMKIRTGIESSLMPESDIVAIWVSQKH